MTVTRLHMLLALFIAFLLIIVWKPGHIYDTYQQSILGRIVLIGVVIFFAKENMVLGLLAALILIAVSNQFGMRIEGLDTMPTTIGDDNANTAPATTATVPVTTTASSQANTNIDEQAKKVDEIKKKLSDLKAKLDEDGVDREDIKDAIKAKPSNSMPVDKSAVSSTEDVAPAEPSTKEGVGSGWKGGKRYSYAKY